MITSKKKKNRRRCTVRHKQSFLGGQLTLINTLNEIKLYSLNVDSCIYYISNQNGNEYIYVDSATPRLLKFEDDTPINIPENMKQIIQNNLNKKTGKPKILTIGRIFQEQYNALYFFPTGCFKPIELTTAHKKINELNDFIKTKRIFLSLDYVYNIKPPKGIITLYAWLGTTQLVLCLNNDEGCIASIGLSPDSESIRIYSKTKPEYEGRKYNTLLRCVVMILAPLLSSDFKLIKSEAENPISAYLLLQKFDGFIPNSKYNEDITKFLSAKEQVQDYRTLLQEYKLSLGGESFGVEIHCPVNEDTVKKNESAFHDYFGNIPSKPKAKSLPTSKPKAKSLPTSKPKAKSHPTSKPKAKSHPKYT